MDLISSKTDRILTAFYFRYRLRLINTGSFASIRFSVDWHPLTLIEADGVLLQPTPIESVTLTVAQRYSVLLHTNATVAPNGQYWMRATIQENMFRYEHAGLNTDIRGIIQFVCHFNFEIHIWAIFRYSDVPETSSLPGDPDSPNPGVGVENLLDVNGHTLLTPLVPDPPPEATRSYYLTFSFQKIYTGHVLGFMNTTVCYSPLPL